MFGGRDNQDMEGEEDCLVEMGGGRVEEDPLGDFSAKVKDDLEGASGREWRGGGGVSRKRRNLNGMEDSSSKRHQGNKEENCVFCLRNITDNPVGGKESVPKEHFSVFVQSTLLSTVNQIWPYLAHNFKDPENLIPFIERIAPKTKNKFTGFTMLPGMCGVCAGNLKSVDKLLKYLERQIRRLGSVLQESRAAQFHRSLMESEEEPEQISHSSPPPQQQASLFQNEEIPHDVEDRMPESPVSIPEDGPGSEDELDSDPDYIKSEPESESCPSSPEECETFEPEPPTQATKKRDRPQTSQVDNPDFTCSKCDKLLSSKGALKYHMEHVHAPGNKPKTDWSKIDGNLPVDCEHCGKSYLQKYLPVHHKTAHADENKTYGNRCDLCGDRVPFLYEHLKQHVGEEYVTKCPNPKCTLAYAQLRTLCMHLKSKTCRDAIPPGVQRPRMNYICEVCGFTTGHGLNLRAHLTAEHETATKNFPCPVTGCSQSFTLRQSVVLHLPHHDFPRASQRCPLCNELTKVHNMEEHLKDKHQVPEIIKCNQCSFLFSTREQLIEHLFDHRFGELKCDICHDGVKYSRHAHLQDHYFTLHKIGVKYSCEVCERVFWKMAHLTDHMKTKHKGEGESSNPPEKKKTKIFRCEDCDLEWNVEISLKEHNIRFHGAEPFSCTFCTEKFPKRDFLLKHVREHKGVITVTPTQFKCEVEGCGKMFNAKKLLKRHNEATHLGIRHVCELCGKNYSDKKSLQNHHEIVHLGLRPWVCDECGESFVDASVLKKHKLIHTGDRPFPCEICGQRFRQQVVLRRHLEGHQKKGTDFKPNGPMKQIRKRVERKKHEKLN